MLNEKITTIDRNNYPEEAEQYGCMQLRIKTFFDKVFKKHHKETVLFVGHGEINMTLLNAIERKNPEDIKSQTLQKNTAVTIVEISEDDNYIIHLHNCTKHLE